MLFASGNDPKSGKLSAGMGGRFHPESVATLFRNGWQVWTGICTVSIWRQKAGVTAIVQPGGSIRDEETIKAADEHGIAMIFTGTRHFRH